MTIKHQIQSVVFTGATGGHPWLAIRFRDLWKHGLHEVRADKVNAAMEEVLREAGIETVFKAVSGDEVAETSGYITLISPEGYTVYVGDVGRSFTTPEMPESILRALEEATTVIRAGKAASPEKISE